MASNNSNAVGNEPNTSTTPQVPNPASESTTILYWEGPTITAQPRSIKSFLPITLLLHGTTMEYAVLEKIITDEGDEPLPPGRIIPRIHSLIRGYDLQMDTAKNSYQVVRCPNPLKEVYGFAYRIETARHLYLINQHFMAMDPEQAFVLVKTPFLSTESGFGMFAMDSYRYQHTGYMYTPAPVWNAQRPWTADEVALDDVDFADRCARNAGVVNP